MEKNSKLPISIKLLFENKYLECINILQILNINNKQVKGTSLEELLYFSTVLNFLKKDIGSGFFLEKTYLQNNYFKYESRIKEYLIILINENLVELRIEELSKKSIMHIMITQLGREVLNELESSYFKDQIEKIKFIKKDRPFNSKNEKGVLKIYEK